MGLRVVPPTFSRDPRVDLAGQKPFGLRGLLLTQRTFATTFVDAKIAKEPAADRLAGPFVSPPISPFIVSPLGVVPKKSPGEFRLIHHLSFAKGASVNDGISHENSTVCYATIGDSIRCMKLAGRACYLAKTDIKNAFRIIPIQSGDYGLLGIHWNGSFSLF